VVGAAVMVVLVVDEVVVNGAPACSFPSRANASS
jgi:hypothetical protein